MSFAATLRFMREQRLLSKNRLAGASGVSRTMIIRCEAGSRVPSRVTVRKLATGMHLTPAEYRELAGAAGFLVGQQHDEQDGASL